MQRLAGAEEVRQAPDNRLIGPSVNKDVENSVQACLLKVYLNIYTDYLFTFFLPLTDCYRHEILCRHYFVRIILENKKTPHAVMHKILL